MSDFTLTMVSAWWTRFSASAYAHTLVAYFTSFVLGTLIGLERQWRQRTAGLRTNVLVAVGSAAFSDLGMRLLGAEGASRIISYVVSGIGFLGAGVILTDRVKTHGRNDFVEYFSAAAQFFVLTSMKVRCLLEFHLDILGAVEIYALKISRHRVFTQSA